MSEQSRPEQHRDYYPHDSSQVLEWHERRHEAVHEILTKAGIKGSLTLLVEERVQRLACLHLEAVAKVQRLTSELESAQKMADHWEKKAAERQGQVNEWRAKVDQLFDENERVRGTLDAANVVKYHPVNEIGECKLMTLAERVESLVESWNNWEQVSFKNLAQAEKAEADRDELKRRAENAELELNRQKELVNPVDWERVRIDAAIATMQGMWACPDANFMRPMEVISVECADALVAELQKKEVQG